MGDGPDTAFFKKADWTLLRDDLAADIETSIEEALDGGAIFAEGESSLDIFRDAVREAIRDVEAHPRGRLLLRFLRDGPYEGQGPIPVEHADDRLSDEDTARAVRFVYSFMVNSFKGQLAELLAAGPCLRVLSELRRRGHFPEEILLYAGDTVSAATRTGRRAKGADFHMLTVDGERHVTVWGVAEVKSFPLPKDGLDRQLRRHVRRARRGVTVESIDYDPSSIRTGPFGPALVEVTADRWLLSREFHLDAKGVHLSSSEPPQPADTIEEVTADRWRVRLRWSQEALAEAALEMTFWYMGNVGETLYADRPSPWSEMTAREAGLNSAKMMLYYTLLRLRPGSVGEQQAIALYNAYGFGYALGTSFAGPTGRREMLWFEDLREIAELGRTSKGCRIRGVRSRRS